MNSKSLEYEDVLYFDLQPHPMAYTLGSVVMEWKQILPGSYIWKECFLMTGWCDIDISLIMKNSKSVIDLKANKEGGWGAGYGSVENFKPISNIR